MVFIAAFSGKMENIVGVDHLTANPVRYIFTKAATYTRIIAPHISFTEVFKSCFMPVTNWHHDTFLVHIETTLLIELEQALPTVTETIGPLTRMAIALMPDKFFSPQPALSAHGHNKLKDVGVPFAVHYFFFDIENKRAFWFQYTLEF